MVEIVVHANTVASGAIVTGYAVSADRPRFVSPCEPSSLTRIYRGFGKLRAETGAAPRRGFGRVIGCAEIGDRDMSRGLALWLRVQD
jgi:hypothetical protein